ncbi:cell division protein ZipA [Pseudomaricurvus alcaniphilus]|uniref:cell division protein ZipA n=1 Tax=Pseudomaricurvus alcaniphilus TaxID=1166482 RepID=UPI00140BDD4E|nr:cell division protein ZipA [Pseudomaricurvus alcaniphilus]NHN36000.1 cell division protein ZipA [Pseudomaricurvus alcaniphilus]
MREWLTVIIVFLIIGVLLDGWRRMRQSRRQSIKMSRSVNKGLEKGELDTFGSELPNGGARVVSKRGEEDARAVTQSMKESYRKKRTTVGMRRIPQQVTLNLDEEVPVLMESVAGESTKARSKARVEPTFSADEAVADDESDNNTESEPQEFEEDGADYIDDDHFDPLFAEPKDADRIQLDEDDVIDSGSGAETEEEAEPDEVLVINVMAGADGPFPGEALLEVILECGMRYGDMKIFHRYTEENGDGPLMFSMVNMVVPGTFDLQHMAEFETPGVSLFMTLPMSANSIKAFNTMAVTAAAIAERLGGELKDETRSAMTNQTLEHCRQRILEYERKRQLAAH